MIVCVMDRPIHPDFGIALLGDVVVLDGCLPDGSQLLEGVRVGGAGCRSRVHRHEQQGKD